MDFTKFAEPNFPTRRDGWSAELKVRFLDQLAAKGTVRSGCALTGMSREAAYRLRRRDPLFARGWNAALALAQENSADVLTCRAIDGIEEDIWHRGELVGTRTRHDTRLLLAHIARLDRLVEQSPAGADAGRFDELLAAIAGLDVHEDIALDSDGLPLDRDAAIADAAGDARAECMHAPDEAYAAEGAPAWGEDKAFDEERYAIFQEMCADAEEDASVAMAAQWDAWFSGACELVDGIVAGSEMSLRTVSTMSTSGGAEQAGDGRGARLA